MPGVERLSVEEAVREAERAAKLAIPCLALFPYTIEAARPRRQRGPQSRQSGLPYHPGHQEGSADIGILCDVAPIPIPAMVMTGSCAMALS